MKSFLVLASALTLSAVALESLADGPSPADGWAEPASALAFAPTIDVPTGEPALERLVVAWDGLLPLGCYTCGPCGTDNKDHELYGQPPPAGGKEAAHTEECQIGSCADHDDCGPGMAAANEAMWQVTRAALEATPSELAAVLDRHPGRMQVNNERAALQLIGCGGVIVASYPAASLPALRALFQ
jgi:hypothetical protein